MRAAAFVEVYKLELAIKLRFLYRWDPDMFALFIIPPLQSGQTLEIITVFRKAWGKFRSLFRPTVLDHPNVEVFNSAPSLTVWLW